MSDFNSLSQDELLEKNNRKSISLENLGYKQNSDFNFSEIKGKEFEFEINNEIRSFQITKLLGEGGCSQVYEAYPQELSSDLQRVFENIPDQEIQELIQTIISETGVPALFDVQAVKIMALIPGSNIKILSGKAQEQMRDNNLIEQYVEVEFADTKLQTFNALNGDAVVTNDIPFASLSKTPYILYESGIFDVAFNKSFQKKIFEITNLIESLSKLSTKIKNCDNLIDGSIDDNLIKGLLDQFTKDRLVLEESFFKFSSFIMDYTYYWTNMSDNKSIFNSLNSCVSQIKTIYKLYEDRFDNNLSNILDKFEKEISNIIDKKYQQSLSVFLQVFYPVRDQKNKYKKLQKEKKYPFTIDQIANQKQVFKLIIVENLEIIKEYLGPVFNKLQGEMELDEYHPFISLILKVCLKTDQWRDTQSGEIPLQILIKKFTDYLISFVAAEVPLQNFLEDYAKLKPILHNLNENNIPDHIRRNYLISLNDILLCEILNSGMIKNMARKFSEPALNEIVLAGELKKINGCIALIKPDIAPLDISKESVAQGNTNLNLAQQFFEWRRDEENYDIYVYAESLSAGVSLMQKGGEAMSLTQGLYFDDTDSKENNKGVSNITLKTTYVELLVVVAQLMINQNYKNPILTKIILSLQELLSKNELVSKEAKLFNQLGFMLRYEVLKSLKNSNLSILVADLETELNTNNRCDLKIILNDLNISEDQLSQLTQCLKSLSVTNFAEIDLCKLESGGIMHSELVRNSLSDPDLGDLSLAIFTPGYSKSIKNLIDSGYTCFDLIGGFPIFHNPESSDLLKQFFTLHSGRSATTQTEELIDKTQEHLCQKYNKQLQDLNIDDLEIKKKVDILKSKISFLGALMDHKIDINVLQEGGVDISKIKEYLDLLGNKTQFLNELELTDSNLFYFSSNFFTEFIPVLFTEELGIKNLLKDSSQLNKSLSQMEIQESKERGRYYELIRNIEHLLLNEVSLDSKIIHKLRLGLILLRLAILSLKQSASKDDYQVIRLLGYSGHDWDDMNNQMIETKHLTLEKNKINLLKDIVTEDNTFLSKFFKYTKQTQGDLNKIFFSKESCLEILCLGQAIINEAYNFLQSDNLEHLIVNTNVCQESLHGCLSITKQMSNNSRNIFYKYLIEFEKELLKCTDFKSIRLFLKETFPDLLENVSESFEEEESEILDELDEFDDDSSEEESSFDEDEDANEDKNNNSSDGLSLFDQLKKDIAIDEAPIDLSNYVQYLYTDNIKDYQNEETIKADELRQIKKLILSVFIQQYLLEGKFQQLLINKSDTLIDLFNAVSLYDTQMRQNKQPLLDYIISSNSDENKELKNLIDLALVNDKESIKTSSYSLHKKVFMTDIIDIIQDDNNAQYESFFNYLLTDGYQKYQLIKNLNLPKSVLEEDRRSYIIKTILPNIIKSLYLYDQKQQDELMSMYNLFVEIGDRMNENHKYYDLSNEINFDSFISNLTDIISNLKQFLLKNKNISINIVKIKNSLEKLLIQFDKDLLLSLIDFYNYKSDHITAKFQELVIDNILNINESFLATSFLSYYFDQVNSSVDFSRFNDNYTNLLENISKDGNDAIINWCKKISYDDVVQVLLGSVKNSAVDVISSSQSEQIAIFNNYVKNMFIDRLIGNIKVRQLCVSENKIDLITFQNRLKHLSVAEIIKIAQDLNKIQNQDTLINKKYLEYLKQYSISEINRVLQAEEVINDAFWVD